MLSKSLALVASFVALAATASAEADKPRIYFPRHVKRQYGNSTAVTDFDTTTSSDATTSSESTKRDGGLVGGLISDIFGDGDSSEASVTTVAVTSYVYVKPTSHATTTSDSSIVIGPTGIISSAEPTSTSSSDDGGLLDPINSLISDVFHTPTASSTRNSTATATASTGASSTTSTSESDSETPTSTEDKGLLPSLLPTLSSLLPSVSDSETTTTGTSPESTSFIGLLPTANATSPDSTTVPAVETTSVPTTTTSNVIPTSAVTSGTKPLTSPVIVANSTSEATGPPTTINTIETSSPVIVVNSTSVAPTELPTTSLDTSAVVTSGVPQNATSAAPPATTDVTTVEPTTAPTNTNAWLPTSIVIEHTSHTYQPPTATDTASSTAIPTNVPKQIAPDNHDEPAPDGTVAIQLGFKYPLNWQFVADHTTAASQIFAFLPKGLADAGQFSEDKIQITKLVPWNTNDKWGYITTLVKLYYPENMVDSFQTQLWAPNSALYNNELGIVRDLTGVLNPQIDLFGNGVNEAGQGGSGAGDSGSDDGSFNSNDGSDSSSKQKATTAGIAVGAFGLSVMYGAAMFIVARRYKRKKQSHRRANSVTSSQVSSEMGYAAGSPALMGGALMSRDMSNYGGVAGGRESHGSGRSGATQSTRTANISAPLAAENSLGWN